MRITEIQYPSHPQHLLKLECPSIPYICNGCYELGFGICYQCETCNFHLHKECAVPSSSLHHRFFKECEFKFYNESPRIGGRVCDGCWRDVRGFVYQCSHEKAYDLHPSCAKLPCSLSGEGVKLQLKKNVKSKCMKCQSRNNSNKGAKGWSYVSTCGKYCFHVACVKDMIYDAWEMGYFDSQGSDMGDNNKNITSILGTQEMVIPASSSTESLQQRSGCAEASNYWKMVAPILQLILSVIFGDPITALTTLIISLVQTLGN